MIAAFLNHQPQIDASAKVHQSAFVNGQVRLAAGVSVWPTAVIRGDVAAITVGEDTNIQDGAVLHTSHGSAYGGEFPLHLGARVTVGHRAVLHGCRIEDEVLIGMGAIVLDGAHLASHVIVAAGALVPPKKRLESGWIYAGNPARPLRPLTEAEHQFFAYSAQHYRQLAAQYDVF